MQLRVNIHGKVLVDGHHLLLEMLRDIETFNRYVEEHPKFLRGTRNIWLDPHPVKVAEATGDVIKILQKTLPLEIAQRLADRTRSVSHLLSAKGLQEEASRFSTVDGHSDILIFDARMPPVANAIKELEKKRRICLRQGFAPLQIDRLLKLARAGCWEFWDDGVPRKLPYGFKNEFLDVLKHPWHGWKEHLGKRKFDVSKRGLYQKEKGVDTSLVIAGCQAAAEPMLDWICLVTNDADYVPLVEHLHSRGKAVYLLSLGDPKGQSRDLKNAVGSRYLINKAKLYNGLTDEPIPEPYWSMPALIFLLPYCLF